MGNKQLTDLRKSLRLTEFTGPLTPQDYIKVKTPEGRPSQLLGSWQGPPTDGQGLKDFLSPEHRGVSR